MENEIIKTENYDVVEYEQEEGSKGVSAKTVVGGAVAAGVGILIVTKLVAPRVKRWRKKRAEKILAAYNDDDEFYDDDYDEYVDVDDAEK